MYFVNPLTAIGLIETAKSHSSAIIQTGAASQLGRMVVKLCKREKIPLINIVRKQEHVELLEKLGAEHILNSSDPNWEKELEELARRLKARACFEAVAGEVTGRILLAMPRDSIVYLYGLLSGLPAAAIDPIDTIFRNKRLQGWALHQFLREQGLIARMRLIGRVQKLLIDQTAK